MCPCPRPGSRRTRLRHQDQVQLRRNQLQIGSNERDEPISGQRPWTERWLPTEHPSLQFHLSLIQQRNGETALVAEAPVQRPFADPGLRRDLVHRHPGHPARCEQSLCRSEHPEPVPSGIRPLPDDPLLQDGQLPSTLGGSRIRSSGITG